MNPTHRLIRGRQAAPTLALLCLGLGLAAPGTLRAQSAPPPVSSAAPPASSAAARPLTPAEIRQIDKDTAAHIGDQPDDAPPLATDLSPALTPDAVLKATRKVADWQLARAEPFFNRQWTYGALYTGFMCLSQEAGDPKYQDAMLAMGKKLEWKIGGGPRGISADDQCIGQTFVDLSFQQHDPTLMAPTRAGLDQLLATPDPTDNPTRPVPWWWCDALYMAPSVWLRVYKATGDAKYLDYMDRQWWACSKLLYDPQDHLYHRDLTYLDKTEANGKKMYWSRGNGWVLGGLARVLPLLPADYPDRPKYVAQFQEMAKAVAALQGPDGLWRSGLLDPDAYDLPENSGSAFFTYALAWGINQGLLDRATYRPVVARAWAGLLSHVYADGRLGCIQQTGAEPAHFKPTATAVYGVGAFLLAGSELHRLALTPEKPAAKGVMAKGSTAKKAAKKAAKIVRP